MESATADLGDRQASMLAASDKMPSKADTIPADEMPDKADTIPADKMPDKADTIPANKMPDKADTVPADKMPDKADTMSANKEIHFEDLLSLAGGTGRWQALLVAWMALFLLTTGYNSVSMIFLGETPGFLCAEGHPANATFAILSEAAAERCRAPDGRPCTVRNID